MPVALLDACVLVPYNLMSFLLTCAKAEVFEPRWSETILDEVDRTLTQRLGLSQRKADHRIAAMRSAFPEAAVAGYEWLEPALTCDPKDRHVLAAAVATRAEWLVTANLKDFPPASTEPHGIEVLHPDAFLLKLIASHPSAVVRAINMESERRSNPKQSVSGLLESLARLTPRFAEAVRQQHLRE